MNGKVTDYTSLQVHFDGVDRKSNKNLDGYWGFGIYIDPDPTSNTAWVRNAKGDMPLYIYTDYKDLLEQYMRSNNIDCPAHLCTSSYPFRILATRH